MDDGCAPPDCCSRCLNHDVVTLNGHKNKRNCQYIDCNCEKCLLSANHRAADAGQTAICGTEEQDRSRELNGVLPVVDNPTSFGQTFTSFKAAMLDGTDFLQRALDAGMDINKPLYPFGPTPLHVAVSFTNGRQHIAKYLLDKGANINGKDVRGYTPLMEAVSTNQTECIELLLEKGACVNEQSYVRRKSCLHIACETGNIELARILIRHGANINARSVYGSTPLHCVVQNYPTTSVMVELCKLLIDEGADLNIAGRGGNTLLHNAVKYRSVILTELLLSRDIDLESCNNDGKTPLLLAFNHKPSLCTLLVKAGANVNLLDVKGNTTLHMIFLSRFFKPNKFTVVLGDLLDKGVDINNKNMDGDTALILAIKSKSYDDIMLLIRRGSDINLQNNEGNTPLHIAYSNGFRSEVNTLLKSGSDVNVPNRNGETLLHIAMSRFDTSFLELVRDSKIQMDLIIQNNKGNTPLHNAIMAIKDVSTDTSTVEWLIDNATRVDITNNYDQTAFDVAQLYPDVEAIMAKHITKMRVAGMHVGVSSEIIDQDMEVRYLEEMEQIKSTKINEKHTLDVLFSNIESPMYLTTSKAFVENIMTTPTLEEIFPHYASLLRIQYMLARKRFDLFNLTNSSLAGCTNMTYLHKLPYVFIQKTLECLNNEELQSLIKSLNISQALDD